MINQWENIYLKFLKKINNKYRRNYYSNKIK